MRSTTVKLTGTSKLSLKKYKMTFYKPDGSKKTVEFGAKGYSDYTKHHDHERKMRYLKRHHDNEDWYDPYTAGALSRWILWNMDTVKDSFEDYKRRFGFEDFV